MYLGLLLYELVQEGGGAHVSDGVSCIVDGHACQQGLSHGRHRRVHMLCQQNKLPHARPLSLAVLWISATIASSLKRRVSEIMLSPLCLAY